MSYPITFTHKGDFSKTMSFLERARESVNLGILDKYGRKGVEALREATPRDTGKTAESWNYEIIRGNGEVRIVWTNSNTSNGIPIAVLIQYGHATGSGGYVEGRDYINPAMQPIFDAIAHDSWKELTKK